MRARLVSALWGVSAVGILGLGLFLFGDRAHARRLTCNDLLNLPIEDLMEVNILSRVDNHGCDQKGGIRSPSPLPRTSFRPSVQSGIV
jgi:hypothetical protein